MSELDLFDSVRPPFKFTGVKSVAFELPAKMDALKKLCKTFLNEPFNRAEEAQGSFTPQDNYVLLSFGRFPSSAGAEAGSTKISYREVSLMFPVQRIGPPPQAVSFFAPILFLDGGTGSNAEDAGNADVQAIVPIAIGRELYGLQKTRGEIDFDFDFDFGSLPGPAVELRGVQSGSRANNGMLSLNDFVRIKTAPPPQGGFQGPPVRGTGIGVELLGVRQLRDPTNPPLTPMLHRDVVRTRLDIDGQNNQNPSPAISSFVVSFNQARHGELLEQMGLTEPKYTVDGTKVAVFKNVNCTFGDPTKTHLVS